MLCFSGLLFDILLNRRETRGCFWWTQNKVQERLPVSASQYVSHPRFLFLIRNAWRHRRSTEAVCSELQKKLIALRCLWLRLCVVLKWCLHETPDARTARNPPTGFLSDEVTCVASSARCVLVCQHQESHCLARDFVCECVFFASFEKACPCFSMCCLDVPTETRYMLPNVLRWQALNILARLTEGQCTDKNTCMGRGDKTS